MRKNDLFLVGIGVERSRDTVSEFVVNFSVFTTVAEVGVVVHSTFAESCQELKSYRFCERRTLGGVESGVVRRKLRIFILFSENV